MKRELGSFCRRKPGRGTPGGKGSRLPGRSRRVRGKKKILISSSKAAARRKLSRLQVPIDEGGNAKTAKELQTTKKTSSWGKRMARQEIVRSHLNPPTGDVKAENPNQIRSSQTGWEGSLTQTLFTFSLGDWCTGTKRRKVAKTLEKSTLF